MSSPVWLWLALAQVVGPSGTTEATAVHFAYDVRLKTAERAATVELRVQQDRPGISLLRFHIDPDQHSSFRGDGVIETEGDEYVTWNVPAQGGRLRWTSRLDHLRDAVSYDARMGTNWALFRGSDLVPPAASRFVGGSTSTGEARFVLPKRWKLVSRHPVETNGRRVLRDDRRFFLRPSGWMMAGRLKTEVAEISTTEVVLCTTRRLGLALMEVRSFLRWTLPAFESVLGALPPRIVIVGAGDPMWRGGLSGQESLFVHRDRPLVDDDGTSPLLHELAHVFMGAKSGPGGDWIVEGLAEYYAIEVLYRSGGMSGEERRRTHRDLRRRGNKVASLATGDSRGAVTARAVAVLARLDQIIRDQTDDRAYLDLVVRRLIREDVPITTSGLRAAAEEVSGRSLETFFATYVDKAQPP